MRKNMILAAIMLIMGMLISLSSHPVMGPTEALGQSSKKVLMMPRIVQVKTFRSFKDQIFLKVASHASIVLSRSFWGGVIKR